MVNHLLLRSTLFSINGNFVHKYLRPLSTVFLLLFVLLRASSHVSGQSLSTSVTFPRYNSSYVAGSVIEIKATATTPVSTTVAKVEFFYQESFSGSYIKIGEDLTAPYSYTWTLPIPTQTSRSYQIRAIVTNTASNTAIANPSVGYYNISVYRPDYISTRNWYVNAEASAANTAATEASPFNTLQKAMDRVAPGDTVFLMGNTPLSGSVSIQRTGLPSKWIVIMPYRNDKPVIKMNDSDWSALTVLPAAAYIRIQGLEVIGNSVNQPLEATLPQALNQPGSCANPGGTPLAKYNGNGIVADGRNGQNLKPHHITMINNLVHDCGGGGILAIEADYMTLESNTIFNTSWYTIYATSGISIFHPWNYDNNTTDYRNIVRNNKSYGNRLYVPWVDGCRITDGNGIIIDDFENSQASSTIQGQFYTGRTLLANNVVFNNGGSGVILYKGINVDVINNTSYQNSQSDPTGELYANASRNVNIVNNIIRPIKGEPTSTVTSNTAVSYDNNLYIVDNPTTQVPVQTSGAVVTNNSVIAPSSETAVFANPGTDGPTADFRLIQGSRAINAGSNAYLSVVPADFLYISRPQGSGVDIGAYEFTGQPIAITRQPASQSAVCVGGSVSVSVGVSGSVDTFMWYKDGVALTTVISASTATLSLPSVTTADQGSYQVVISGFNSLTSASFVLNVNAVSTASLNVSGSISCTTPIVTLRATPTSGVSYTFSSGVTSNSGSSTTTVSQAGIYSVTVTSPEGCSSSASVTITGDLTPPNAPAINSVTATQGTTNVTLSVSNCSGTVNWNGTDGRTTLDVSTTVVGEFVYAVTCKIGVCISPVTSVTVSVKAPPATLSVSYRDGDANQPANNTIRPYLKLINESTAAVPYAELSVRYWLTVEDFNPLTNLSVYWAQVGTSNVRMRYVPLAQPRQGALGYIEYTFDASAGILAPSSNSGEIQTGVGKQDWTNLNELDDYSFAPNTSYTKTDRITIYRNGVLVAGVEPDVSMPRTALKVYAQNRNSNPATNQISTHLKVANEGNLPVDFSQLTVRYWFSSEGITPLVYSLDYAKLGNSNVISKFVKENRADTDTYLELSFTPGLGQLQALSSTGLIQQRINKTDWSTFNEANDYSYKPTGPLAENATITAYLNGSLVYGQEPGPSGARLSIGEPSAMRVVVLGNPIEGNTVTVEVSGVEGQPVRLQVTDVQGRTVSRHQTERAGLVETYQLSIDPKQVGILLLDVHTASEKQTLRLFKP